LEKVLVFFLHQVVPSVSWIVADLQFSVSVPLSFEYVMCIVFVVAGLARFLSLSVLPFERFWRFPWVSWRKSMFVPILHQIVPSVNWIVADLQFSVSVPLSFEGEMFFVFEVSMIARFSRVLEHDVARLGRARFGSSRRSRRSWSFA
jgi:hypothetical protein